jgi:biotin-dependent carboxylase-like uncharacterized protein
MNLFKIIHPGLFTTVQDLGRYEYQRYGVPISGAMDTEAFTIANYLVGNDPNDAGLETTLLGPDLMFLQDSWVAITGATLTPTLNREEIPCWETVKVRKGDLLSFGHFHTGCRVYLAIRGGLDVPTVMGSRSTYTRNQFGGYKGRVLRKGDIVKGTPSREMETGYSLPKKLRPTYRDEIKVEIVLGPQIEYFSEEGVRTFLSNNYTVTTEFDRMGYRLDGPCVKQEDFSAMVSDALPIGAIQIPPNGKPIIVMRDAQTTGGYPKIGVITTPDIQKVGQAKPNNTIRFSQISLNKAETKLSEYISSLEEIKNQLADMPLH